MKTLYQERRNVWKNLKKLSRESRKELVKSNILGNTTYHNASVKPCHLFDFLLTSVT